LVLLCFIRSPLQEDRARETASTLRAEAKEGIAYLWKQRFLRYCTLLVAGSNLLFQALFVLTIVEARDRGASATEVGVLFGIVGVFGLVGALAAPAVAERFSGRAVVVGINWLWAATLPLYLLPLPALALGAFFGMMSFAGACWNIVLGAAELRLVPDRLLGRVRGASALFGWGAIPLGGLLGGTSLSALGYEPTVIWMTGSMVALAVIATAAITEDLVGRPVEPVSPPARDGAR
jgi:cyanate permease